MGVEHFHCARYAVFQPITQCVIVTKFVQQQYITRSVIGWEMSYTYTLHFSTKHTVCDAVEWTFNISFCLGVENFTYARHALFQSITQCVVVTL
jgi:hypothetical protein